MNIKWEKGAPAPVGRHGHTAVWLKGLIFVGGGSEKDWNASYIINCYNPVINVWNSITIPYCNFAMTTLNNKLVTAGGKDESSNQTSQILIMNAGQLKKYTNMITARSLATAVGHQGILIVTGGQDDKCNKLSSTELFDSKNGQWYKCSDLPQPHYSLQAVIVDNILYLLGGCVEGDNKYGNYSPAVFTAPLDTLSRHQLKWAINQDTPWCAPTPVSINGTHLLIVGGTKKIGNEYTHTSEIHKFNKVNRSWEAIGHIRSVIDSSAVVSTADKRVIVIGGWCNSETTNTVWIGSLEPQ